MDKYIDWLIEDGGLVLDDGGQPIQTMNTLSISQDIKHTIMESGLARKLLGDRSRTERADVLTEIELLVENDLRIQAGSIWVNEIDHETYQLTATVNTGEPITLNLELHNERA